MASLMILVRYKKILMIFLLSEQSCALVWMPKLKRIHFLKGLMQCVPCFYFTGCPILKWYTYKAKTWRSTLAGHLGLLKCIISRCDTLYFCTIKNHPAPPPHIVDFSFSVFFMGSTTFTVLEYSKLIFPSSSLHCGQMGYNN